MAKLSKGGGKGKKSNADWLDEYHHLAMRWRHDDLTEWLVSEHPERETEIRADAENSKPLPIHAPELISPIAEHFNLSPHERASFENWLSWPLAVYKAARTEKKINGDYYLKGGLEAKINKVQGAIRLLIDQLGDASGLRDLLGRMPPPDDTSTETIFHNVPAWDSEAWHGDLETMRQHACPAEKRLGILANELKWLSNHIDIAKEQLPKEQKPPRIHGAVKLAEKILAGEVLYLWANFGRAVKIGKDGTPPNDLTAFALAVWALLTSERPGSDAMRGWLRAAQKER